MNREITTKPLHLPGQVGVLNFMAPVTFSTIQNLIPIAAYPDPSLCQASGEGEQRGAPQKGFHLRQFYTSCRCPGNMSGL